MVERQRRATPKELMQRAFADLAKRVLSPRYNRDNIQKALDKAAAAGVRTDEDPVALYGKLAVYSGAFAVKAEELGKPEDAVLFTARQQGFQQIGEIFVLNPAQAQSTSPSSPGRTAGRAAG